MVQRPGPHGHRIRLLPRWLWPGTNDGTAAIKLHTRIRAVTGELLEYKLTRGTADDGKQFGVDWSDTGTLFLLDRAFNAACLWFRIHRVGGFFVTRLTASYAPIIVANNRKCRGNSRSVEGLPLREVLEGMQRAVLDVTCTFRVRIQPYRTKKGRYEDHLFRVVAIRNRKTGKYHVYVTNIGADRLAAENIAVLYKLRWEVEISYTPAAEASSHTPGRGMQCQRGGHREVFGRRARCTNLRSPRVYSAPSAGT